MDSLKITDAASAAVATHPRVSLDMIKDAIAERHEFTAKTAIDSINLNDDDGVNGHPSLAVLSICLLVMKNGFVIIGKAAPASPENYNMELGKQFAYEDAVRQLWPLMGYALRDRLMEG